MAWMIDRCRALATMLGLLMLLALLLTACGSGSSQQVAQQTPTPAKKISVQAQTTDKLYTITLAVSPGQLGANTFTVIVNTTAHTPVTNARVSLETTMLDMYMGTDTVTLQSNGKGGYSGTGNLDMDGHWSVRVVIHAPDGTLHEATILFATSD